MNRRNFLRGMLGAALFPVATCAAAKSATPVKSTALMATEVIHDWPMWQYGDYISVDYELTEADIVDLKSLCRQQAKETFEALQVPDACDKIEYIVQQQNLSDPFSLRSTVSWKVTIPAPQWQLVLSKHGDKQGYLGRVLKTRKKLIPVSLNGNTQMIPRRLVRDYLQLMVNAHG